MTYRPWRFGGEVFILPSTAVNISSLFSSLQQLSEATKRTSFDYSTLRLELDSQIEPFPSWTAPKLSTGLEIPKPTRWYGNFPSKSRQVSSFLMRYTPSQTTAGRNERPRLPSGGRAFKIRTLPGTAPTSWKKRTAWANVRSIGKVLWNCTSWMWRRRNWRR